MSLKTRTITGVSFGIVMILGTLISPISSTVLYNIIAILCAWELSSLTLAKDGKEVYLIPRKILSIIITLIPSIILHIHYINHDLLLQNYHWFFLVFVLPFILELRAFSTKPFENIGQILLSLLYIGIPTLVLSYLSLKDNAGRFIIMATMMLVWSNDVFAYLGGKMVGKTKIFPNISPNKTWEGTIIGFSMAILWGNVSYYLWANINFSLSSWIIIAVISSIFAIIGDIVASMLKRSLHIKDTGNVLPGHGGFIDRFDAFLFVIPLVTFTIIYILKDPRFAIIW
jgi:phosphatidate cytidylyltransferase